MVQCRTVASAEAHQPEGEPLVISEEMKRLMAFIVEKQAQTAVKLERLGIRLDARPVAQSRSDKRWKQTEKRIRALLARAKTQERKMAAQRRRILPLGKTRTDRRLKALADLVDRDISERRNGKA